LIFTKYDSSVSSIRPHQVLSEYLSTQVVETTTQRAFPASGRILSLWFLHTDEIHWTLVLETIQYSYSSGVERWRCFLPAPRMLVIASTSQQPLSSFMMTSQLSNLFCKTKFCFNFIMCRIFFHFFS